MHIGWPQGIMLGLMAFVLFSHAFKDGEPRTGKYNLSIQILDAAISFGLLYWGGFFH